SEVEKDYSKPSEKETSKTVEEEKVEEEDVNLEQVLIEKKAIGIRRKTLARRRASVQTGQDSYKRQKKEKETADYEEEKDELRNVVVVVLLRKNCMIRGFTQILVDLEQDGDIWKNQNQWKIISWKLQATNSSGSSFWNVNASSPSTTPVIEKIDQIENLIIEGKVTLVDDDGKPLEKVDSSCDYNSEDEVAYVDNDMAKFLAKKDGYGT
ncbi:hypothetical protein Tco_0977896, partial [Tanacetum coccineum]